MRTRNSAEAWKALCLRDEAEQLTVAVRMLEHTIGYHDGVHEAMVAA